MKRPFARSIESRQALAALRQALPAILFLSFVIALFPVALGLFALLLFDVAIPGRSMGTLLGLCAMIVAVGGFACALTAIRQRILGRLADLVDGSLATRLEDAACHIARDAIAGAPATDGPRLARDVEAIGDVLRSGTAARWIDMGALPLLLIVMTLLQPWCGLTLAVGATAMAWSLRRSMRSGDVDHEIMLDGQRSLLSEVGRAHADVIQAMGLRPRLSLVWNAVNYQRGLRRNQSVRGAATHGVIAQFLHAAAFVAIIAVGAALTMSDRMNPAAVLAAGIIGWFALAPLAQAVRTAAAVAAARTGWTRIDAVFAAAPPERAAIPLPDPTASLACETLALGVPGVRRPVVQGVDFTLEAGEALVVVGPAGCGKSALLRGLCGAWPLLAGKVRLDGAALDQWNGAELGRHIGYLPQTIDLIPGTIAQNIARFQGDASAEGIVKAAKEAEAHDAIVRLPQGYATPVGPGGRHLSQALAQRVGLARAFYGAPFLIALDGPTTHQDIGGESDFVKAVANARARGAIVLLAGTQACLVNAASHVLVIENGAMVDVGDKDAVRRRMIARRSEPAITEAPDAPETPAIHPAKGVSAL